jgi:hypothetical protein
MTRREEAGVFKNVSPVKLYLSCKSGKTLNFSLLFQQGVGVPARVGQSVKRVLCEQWGINPEYLDKRVKTIFLDGKPVDDIDKAILQDGSALSLSAAMPGLAGATLRRGGILAPLRSQITHREEKKAAQEKEGLIILKLFNLLGAELGPLLLKRGIYIQGGEFVIFIKNLSEEFWLRCQKAKLNDQKIDVQTLREGQGLDSKDLIYLQMDFAE